MREYVSSSVSSTWNGWWNPLHTGATLQTCFVIQQLGTSKAGLIGGVQHSLSPELREFRFLGEIEHNPMSTP